MKTKDKQIITFSPSFLSCFFLATKDRFTLKQEVAALGSSFCAGWGCETGGAGGTLLLIPQRGLAGGLDPHCQVLQGSSETQGVGSWV